MTKQLTVFVQLHDTETILRTKQQPIVIYKQW